MKIGLLVDGRGEFRALPYLLNRLGSPHQVLAPLKCDMQPLASPGQIALAASKRFPILLDWGAEAIVLLLDKETRLECTGDLVRVVEREARARLKELSSTVGLQVVYKVSQFENWLVADPTALRDLPGLFEHIERIEKRVSNNRADIVDASNLLKVCLKRPINIKMKGAIEICKRLDPARAAENSRSFRKLLKVLDCPPRGPVQRTLRRKARR